MIPLNQILLLCSLGIGTGIFAGLFGIGGGIVIVPSLIFLFRYSYPMATATSLVALLMPVGLLGVIEYYRSGKIGSAQIKFGLIIAVGLFLGTFLGARLANILPVAILQKAFSVFLLFIAYRLWFSAAA